MEWSSFVAFEKLTSDCVLMTILTSGGILPTVSLCNRLIVVIIMIIMIVIIVIIVIMMIMMVVIRVA